VRRVRLADGTELREQLLRQSDRERSFSYCVLDSPLPLFDFVATVSLRPVTDGDRTFWHWRAQFDTPEVRAAELEQLVGSRLCEAGFTGLRRLLAEEVAPTLPPTAEAKVAVEGEPLLTRAVVVKAAGAADVLTVDDLSVPPPGPQQVRLRQHAVAVNFGDILMRRGWMDGTVFPATPGVEGVGVVVDVGPGVDGLFPDDRVAYVDPAGNAYAGMRLVATEACLPLPVGVSDIEAATLLKGVTTALLLGRVFRAAARATIMVEAAAGGLGHLLTQWARSLGLTVLGTVSSLEKARFARDRGCDYPIVCTEKTDVCAEVMRATKGRGVDYWVVNSGAQGLTTALTCLSRGGHCAVVGHRGMEAGSLAVDTLRRCSLSVSAPVYSDYITDRQYFQRLAHQLFAKIQSGVIRPAITTFPLLSAADAHRLLEERRNMGAVALIPET
jgi:NADPH:quinone reductase-like Zn-dependent oxidoreductase